jgi:hypothetical protein
MVLLHNQPGSVSNTQNSQFSLFTGTGILDMTGLYQRI